MTLPVTHSSELFRRLAHSPLAALALVALLSACGDDPEETDASEYTSDDVSERDGESDGSSTTDPDGSTTPDIVAPDAGNDAEIQTDVALPDAVDDAQGDAADTVAPEDVESDLTSTDGSASDAGDDDTVETDSDASDTVDSDTTVSCGFAAVGDLLIAEVLPSPATGSTGDANCDGTRNAVDDEFVELVNVSDGCINLENVAIRTTSGDTRVTFDETVTLNAGEALVLFGGNTPTFDGTSTSELAHCIDLSACNVVILDAAPGSLALAPSDTLFVVSSGGETMDSVTWGGEGIALTAGESLTRATLTAETAFETHGTSDRGLMSPGQTWEPRACY